MTAIDPKRSFRYNYNAGVQKEELMRYYGIESEKKWDMLMETLKITEGKELRKKIIMGKEQEVKS